MTENIQLMFSKMSDETRDKAIKHLKEELNLNSETKIQNTWLIGGRVPEEYQERTVNLFQILLREEVTRTREIIVNL